MDVSIGFLGFGNMAQAIVEGWVKVGAMDLKKVHASAVNQDKLQANTERLGIQAQATNEDLVDQSDIVIVAVKPHLVAEVLEPLRDRLQDKIVVSLAVNVLFEDYEGILVEGTQHLSTLPNTPVSVGQGAIIFEGRHSLSPESYDLVLDLFETIASVTVVDTSSMGVAGVINGCGPAFVAMFIEALADGAVKHGLGRKEAYELVSQTLIGTGTLQKETGEHPGVMKDKVTSPGGTTIKGVSALEAGSFRHDVMSVFDAILEK